MVIIYNDKGGAGGSSVDSGNVENGWTATVEAEATNVVMFVARTGSGAGS